MSPSRLRAGEWLATLGAIVLLVALLALHWYCNPTLGGWRAVPTLRWFVLVTGVLGIALALAQAALAGSALPVTLDLLTTLVAGLTTILVAIRLITTGATVWTGGYVGVGAAALTTLGAYRAMRTEQGAPPAAGQPNGPIERVELPG